MPSHLRNGRDLSGEQRRRDVEAGLSNITGQRAVQRAQGKPSVPRTDANEPARNECRSDSDGGQLQGHVSSVKVGDVNPSSNTGGSFDRTAKGSVGDGQPRDNYRPGDHSSVEPSPSRRQQTTGDWFMYDEAKKIDDQVVMKAALHQAISSQELICRILSAREMMEVCENWLAQAEMDIMFPEKRASNSLTTSETQASSSTPSHQTGRSSPQEDVAMTYRDPTPVQATAQPASSISSVHQTIHNSAYAPAQNSEQNHAHQAVQYAMNPSNYAYQNVMDAPALNFVPNVMNAQAPNVVQNVTNAPVQNFVPNYATQFQQNRNQSTFEHPRPPQHQQGLPVTSHQAGPTSNNRPNHRARRDRYHYSRNEPAAPQPHPPPQHAPPLTLFNASQVETQGIQEEKEESPTGRQHGSSLGSGKCLLESRKDLREDAKSPGKSECSKQESPKSTSSPVDPYMNLSFNPALEQLSDASQKEFLLSNINNRLAHDNPFLIEDKLQKLFSTFLSDLSGTIDAFPSTVLESCVEKLSSTINSSILELIKSEITPILLDDTLHKLRELRKEKILT
ncbi:hypothetical protein PSHT_16282 [Puccinia striiformis]|uniref:Uncharacterized protein n=1 Tax=Puccinia striiformis TaxID=27350 RepID=A0A2S4UAK7_9BASI|nr:hypothetical protein PSHT_16282 [Puccinia striiformis]